MINYIFAILAFFTFFSCSGNKEEIELEEIMFEGKWYREYSLNGKEIIEQVTISNIYLSVLSFRKEDNVVVEKTGGVIIAGNDNQVLWSYDSQITHEPSNFYFDVISLDENQMHLNSSVVGERIYRKVDDFATLPSLFPDIFEDVDCFLGQTTDEIRDKLGETNHLEEDGVLCYWMNDAVVEQIHFKKSIIDNRIHSYSIICRSSIEYDIISKHIRKNNTLFRKLDTKEEYSNHPEGPSKAHIIYQITTDSRELVVFDIIGYEYWDDLTRCLNKPWSEVRKIYDIYDFLRFDTEINTIPTIRYYHEFENHPFLSKIVIDTDYSGNVVSIIVYTNDGAYEPSLIDNLLARKYHLLDAEGNSYIQRETKEESDFGISFSHKSNYFYYVWMDFVRSNQKN